MDTGPVDYAALALALGISLVIDVALAWADRGAISRRSWLMAAALAAVLIAIGLVEILNTKPREVHVATILFGVPLAILGTLGLVRATRRVRPWARWPVVYVTTLVLLFGGLLIGATLLPRYLGN